MPFSYDKTLLFVSHSNILFTLLLFEISNKSIFVCQYNTIFGIVCEVATKNRKLQNMWRAVASQKLNFSEREN